MPRKNPPILNVGPVSGRVYIVTRYRVIDAERSQFEALEKFDVTDQFEALAAGRDGYARAIREVTEFFKQMPPTGSEAVTSQVFDCFLSRFGAVLSGGEATA